MLFSFFKKKKQKNLNTLDSFPSLTSIQEVEEQYSNGLTLTELMTKDYFFDVEHCQEIILEAYWEFRYCDDWDEPTYFIGIRVIKDGKLIDEILLHTSRKYALFSKHTNDIKKGYMEFAINVVNLLSSKICGHPHDHKLIKKLNCETAIINLYVPNDFVYEPKEVSERLKKIYDIEQREYEIKKKEIQYPKISFELELKQIENEYNQLFK